MKKKVLLIEDNQDLRENTQEILELASYDVESAENGKEGLKLAFDFLPDIILCDIMMPVMDGYETLYILKRNISTKDIPFVFLTAKADRSDLRQGMVLGADDYLTKPFTEMEILKAIEVRLEKEKDRPKHLFSGEIDLNEIKLTFARFCDSMPASAVRIKQFKEKEDVYYAGDSITKIPFLENGKVMTFKTNKQGKEMCTGMFGASEFFGINEIFENLKTRTENAKCLVDCTIKLIAKEDFERALSSNVKFRILFLNLMAKKNSALKDDLLTLAYDSVRKRVSKALIKRYALDQKYQIAITREDLACIAGTSTESAIRVLSDFKEENLIEIEGREIKILSIEELENIKG